MAVESSPQKGTLRIQQPARPRQLEKPTEACTTKTIKAEIYGVEDDRETYVEICPFPLLSFMEKRSLMNGGGDWLPNGRANGADSSHRVNRASRCFQVTECRWRPRAQLPPKSNCLYAEHLINVIKGRHVHGEDVPERRKMYSGTIRACGEGSENESPSDCCALKDVKFVLRIWATLWRTSEQERIIRESLGEPTLLWYWVIWGTILRYSHS